MTQFASFLPILTALALAASGCNQPSVAQSRSNLDAANNTDNEDEDETPSSPVCAAAEAIDDACEAVYGEDVAECAPFDNLDEACEAGEVTDDCAVAEDLDDDCEDLFGEDAAECADSDAVDESCESGEDEEND